MFIGFLVIIQLIGCLEGGWVVETITGSVEAGHFTYYWLSKPGRVIITLTPKQGDPDLYIGENEIKPDVTLDKHSFQSVTCGVDKIFIPPFAIRPIGIGVYGHPSHDNSIYEMQVKVESYTEEEEERLHEQLQKQDEELYYSYDSDIYDGEDDVVVSGSQNTRDDWDESDESPVVSVLVTLLRIVWEIILAL